MHLPLEIYQSQLNRKVFFQTKKDESWRMSFFNLLTDVINNRIVGSILKETACSKLYFEKNQWKLKKPFKVFYTFINNY